MIFLGVASSVHLSLTWDDVFIQAEGSPPLSDLHPMRALFVIPRQNPPKLKQRSKWSNSFIGFVQNSLKKDYHERPCADTLLKHQFIR